MSKLRELLDRYDATISRAANIIDMAQAGGMVLTPTQEKFIGEMMELTRLAMAGAPEVAIIAVLESAHEQAQAIIDEVNS